MMNLTQLMQGKAVIANVPNDCPKRLGELGFVLGEEIEPVLISPLGWPRAYRVMGTVTALRKKDAQRIEIDREE